MRKQDAETTHDLVQKAQKALREVKQPKEAEESANVYSCQRITPGTCRPIGEALKGKKEKALEILMRTATKAGRGP